MLSTKQYFVSTQPFEGTPKDVKMGNALTPSILYTIIDSNAFIINAPEILPTPNQVATGVYYGDWGTEYVGTLAGGTGYPSQGDVEAGVVYGSASEYTGDFHVPAKADVKNGVGYGNAGTEYTGEYAGGAGGVSRGRVVNT